MALVLLGLPEFGVGAVEPIQHAKHPETLVEPGNTKDVRVVTIFYKQESNHLPIYSNQESSFYRYNGNATLNIFTVIYSLPLNCKYSQNSLPKRLLIHT